MAVDLDKQVVVDFAERILIFFSEKPKGSKFGLTHIIEFVRDSHQSDEDTTNYKKMGDTVPAYVRAATSRLVKDGRVKQRGESYFLA